MNLSLSTFLGSATPQNAIYWPQLQAESGIHLLRAPDCVSSIQERRLFEDIYVYYFEIHVDKLHEHYNFTKNGGLCY